MGRLTGILLCVCCIGSASIAQISPGDLTRAHQNIEGIDNCTKCHTIGKALSNEKCLDCHKEIGTRIANKKGYHATVTSKQCVECHKEHHGRNFDIIRFDKKKFNHKEVGYALEGKHGTIECEKCHEKSKITAGDIQALSVERKSKTYLGLSTECLSCHKDEHRGQFTATCLTCHTFNQWKPAEKFSHDKAKFVLVGKHKTVECAQCHKKNWAEGATAQYINMEFGSCRSCHGDPHKGKFAQECSHCHTPDAWNRIRSEKFDHAKTRFPLKGKHIELRCEQCHNKNPKGRNASGELGFHISRFERCRNCHEESHARQFDKRKDRGACESCHNEKGFAPSTYTVFDHARSRFALSGGHGATPCGKCHENGKVRAKSTKLFLWRGTLECTTCHKDVHNGQFAKKMGKKGCETCHGTESWQTLIFSHDKTKFPLRGKHAVIKCAECHKTKDKIVQYVGIALQCNTCHEDQHAGQFAQRGKTECEPCHFDKSWHELKFNHTTQSRFDLTGAHAKVACEDCHKQGIVNNKRIIIYKPLGTACIDCHFTQ